MGSCNIRIHGLSVSLIKTRDEGNEAETTHGRNDGREGLFRFRRTGARRM